MAKIMLFGSSSLSIIPQGIVDWLYQYTQQGHEFIVSDRKGADRAFHKALSSVGATGVATIYSMGAPRDNTWGLKTKQFDTFYNEETHQAVISLHEPDASNAFEDFVIDDVKQEMDIPNTREWYEFIDRQMIEECDAAICLWDGESKGTLHCIQILNIKNKPCYTTKL